MPDATGGAGRGAAGRRHREEVLETLTGRLFRGIAREQVERHPGVRDLGAAVGPVDRAAVAGVDAEGAFGADTPDGSSNGGQIEAQEPVQTIEPPLSWSS